MLSAGGGVEVRCPMRCVWDKFNELMPILTMRGNPLKGEGKDLQSLCAECDYVWQ